MNGGLRLVISLRRRDVKGREGGCEQFRAKHARNVNGFDGSHDDADERERAISSSQEEAVILSSLIMVMGAHGTRQWRDVRSQLYTRAEAAKL